MASGGVLLPQDLPAGLLESRPAASATEAVVRRAMSRTKYKTFKDALLRANGNYREVAALVGIHHKSVHRVLKALKLSHLKQQAVFHPLNETRMVSWSRFCSAWLRWVPVHQVAVFACLVESFTGCQQVFRTFFVDRFYRQ